MKFLLLIFLFLSSAHAQERTWKEGLHLFLGGGLNLSNYHTTGDTLGSGLHFKTDFGYFFQEKWAIESGSNVKFAKVHDTLIWDTLLTIGVRRRLRDNYYARAFIGQAPTVFFTHDSPDLYKRSGSSRILYSGPVIGGGYGKFYQTPDDTVWFWEIGGSFQKLDNAKGVRDKGTVPEVVFQTNRRAVEVYSATFSVGILVF